MILELGKVLAKAFSPFVIQRLKNTKAIRDFQAKWKTDNYPAKMTLMFQAGIDDAKAIIELPDELILGLLEDKINRSEVYRWIIEDITVENFSIENLFLEPYLEMYPDYADNIVPFFKLILFKINDYKETYWDPEFQSILNSISDLKEQIHTGFIRLEKQQNENNAQILEKMETMVLNITGSVGFEDLKVLLNEGKVITALKKAEERLKYAFKNEEKLELNAIIASCYFNSGYENESIPYLYAAITYCDDINRKNRLLALISIFQKEYEKALQHVEENVEVEGYTKNNVELLANIYLLKSDYENCLMVLNKNNDDDLLELKARAFLALEKFDEVDNLIESKLNENGDSKLILLLKADYLVTKMEYLLSNNLLVDPAEIFKIVNPILEIVAIDNENSKQLFRMNELKAAIYFRTKNFKEAALYYQMVYDKSQPEIKATYFHNVVLAHYLGKEFDKAIKLLKENMEKEVDNDDVLLLIRILIDSGRPEEALSILNDKTLFSTSNKLEYEFYLIKLECLFLLMKYKEIELLIKEAEEKNDSSLLLLIKGSFGMLKNEWQEAIGFYEEVINNLDNNNLLLEVKINLIDSYIKSGTALGYEKIVEMVPNIKNWIHHENIVEKYVLALFNTKQHAKILFHYYNDLSKKSIFVQEIVATIYHESDWFKLSSEIYKTLYYITHDVKYLIKYSNNLMNLGEFESCFDALLLAEKKINDKATIEDLHLLSITYMNAMNYDKALEYAYQTFVHGKKNPSVWRWYFSQFTQLSSLVENCKQEYIDSYHTVFEKFSEEFPKETILFEQFEGVNDAGGISNEFIDKLKELENNRISDEALFKKNKFSGEIIRNFTKKDPYQLWVQLAQHQDLRFWSNPTGSEEEVQRGIKTVLSSNRVLIDIFSLFTLRHLDLLDMVTVNKGFQLYIYQHQFSALLYEYSKLKLSSKQGINSIAYFNGQLVGHQITSEQVVETISLYEGLIEWINKNCIIVGKATIDPVDIESIECIVEPILLCKNSSFNMMLDSYVVSNLALEEYKVNTFSVVDFVYYLKNKKQINENQFNELIGKLIMSGYRYITAPPEVFITCLQKNNFTTHGETTWLFNYLKEEGINEQYSFDIIVEVLSWIWKNQIDNRLEITLYLCELLKESSSDINVLEKVIEISDKLIENNENLISEFVDVVKSSKNQDK